MFKALAAYHRSIQASIAGDFEREILVPWHNLDRNEAAWKQAKRLMKELLTRSARDGEPEWIELGFPVFSWKKLRFIQKKHRVWLLEHLTIDGGTVLTLVSDTSRVIHILYINGELDIDYGPSLHGYIMQHDTDEDPMLVVNALQGHVAEAERLAV